MHGLAALFLEMITLGIILLLMRLSDLVVLTVAMGTIMALIVSTTIVRTAIVAITLVASMVVTIFVATVLLVAQFTTTCSRNMSRTLFFWLLVVLGNLLKNTSRFVGCLTLLQKGIELERVCAHRLVCICKLKLMHLGLRKEFFLLSFVPWALPLFDGGSHHQGS